MSSLPPPARGACWSRLAPQHALSSNGRRIVFYLYLLGANVADAEANVDSVAECMRCARREGRPAALLFSHAASFVGLVWHAAIEEFANQCYGASAKAATFADSTLSAFGAEWPAATLPERAAARAPPLPHRMVACAFDFGGHGLSDDVLPFPLPAPSVASAATQSPLEAGVACIAQGAICDRATGSDSVLWRAWRADIGAVIDLLASYAAAAPAEAAAVSASIRSPEPRASDAIQFVGIGHSLGGAALLLAGQDFPRLFRQLVLYEPVMCDPTFKLFYSSSPIPFDRAALAAGAFPLHESLQSLEARPFRLSKEKRHVLTTSTLQMESILPKFAIGVFRRRDSWADMAEAQAYLSKRSMYVNFDKRAFQDFCRAGMRRGDDGRVTLRMRAQSETIVYVQQHTAWERLPENKTKILWIVGPDQLQFGPNTQAQVFACARRSGHGSRALLLTSGNHMFPLEQPGRFAEILVRDILTTSRAAESAAPKARL